jgi:hypothetical protein
MRGEPPSGGTSLDGPSPLTMDGLSATEKVGGGEACEESLTEKASTREWLATRISSQLREHWKDGQQKRFYLTR